MLGVAKIVGSGGLVPHDVDGDFLLCAVGEIHVAGVGDRFHVLKEVFCVIPCVRGAVAGQEGGKTVEIIAGKRDIMREVGHVRRTITRGVGRTDDPDEAGGDVIGFEV